MAYYNYGYPQYYPQAQTQAGTPMSLPNNNGSSIIWVQGEAGAKSYMVAPNTTVALWDSETQAIYLKSADASGMPSMRVLDYTIRQNSSQGLPNAFSDGAADKVSRKDLEALQGQIDVLKQKLEGITNGKSALRANAAATSELHSTIPEVSAEF